MVDLSKGMWNLALLQQQTSYLHYHNVYDHQTWQVVTYHEGLPPIKSDDPLITWFCKIT